MTVLALDMATTTGFAVWHGKGISHGTRSFPVRNKCEGTRFADFRRWLNEMRHQYGEFSMCAYEEAFVSKVNTARVLYGLRGNMLSWAEHQGISCKGYSVTEIKKAFTEGGRASKWTMKDEARRRGFTPKDDNAADALAILFIAMRDAGQEHEFRAGVSREGLR